MMESVGYHVPLFGSGLDSSTDYLLNEAVRGLTFIRKSSDVQALETILPHVVANLNRRMPRAGDKRPALQDDSRRWVPTRYVDANNSRRREPEGGRGRGRGRVRFR